MQQQVLPPKHTHNSRLFFLLEPPEPLLSLKIYKSTYLCHSQTTRNRQQDKRKRIGQTLFFFFGTFICSLLRFHLLLFFC